MSTLARRIAVLGAVGTLAFAGVALAAQSGTYSGTTSQKLSGTPEPIGLLVGTKGVSKATIHAVLTKGGPLCAGGIAHTFSTTKLKIDTHGKFGGKLKAKDLAIKISGQFSGNTVGGSFKLTLTSNSIHGTIKCSTGKVTFKHVKLA